MNRFLLITILVFSTAMASAQKSRSVIRGKLVDTLQKQQLDNATISIVNAKDSSLNGFTRTDAEGRFVIKDLTAGQYLLSASRVGFNPQWKYFEVTEDNKDIDLGKIMMKDKSFLTEVVVSSQRPPVEVNGDTLEFNAEAFKTKPNAVVEDMLKKMPGVEVDKDGTIRVNGQRINRVFVNGKQFFGNDPKIATRNLNADAIDKIQVFDKKNDQAEFTGIDDGSSEKAINLKLKKDRKKMTFGKLTAGAGTNARYESQFNLNRFNGEQQLSAIGMANNTNKQGFTFSDILNFTGEMQRMMRGGGGARVIVNNNGPEDFGLPVQGMNNSEGVAQTIAGGLNFNDTWKKKTEVNGSYFYNNIDVDNLRNVSRQNLSAINPFTYNLTSVSHKRSESSRLNFTIDSKIDSFNSIRFTPQLTYQHNKYQTRNNYESLVTGGKFINNGFSNTTTDAEGYNYTSGLLFRHKFKRRGRTFSANLNLAYNDTRNNGALKSINNFFENSNINERDTIDQMNKLNSVTGSYGFNLSYTEPLSKKSLLEFTGFYNKNNGELDKKTFDINNQNGKYEVLNRELSNAFRSEYTYSGGGIHFRSQQKKLVYGFGATMQYASLLSKQSGENSNIRQHFTNILPAVNATYNLSKTKNIRLEYNTSVQQPTTAQLQPVPDISDPLNIRIGNENLKQHYQHNLNLNYFAASPLSQRNFFAYANFTATQNAIVNADVIQANGKRTTSYKNTDGVYNAFAGFDWGFRVKKLNTRFSFGSNAILFNNYNFLNDAKNRIKNTAINPRTSITYIYKEKFDVTASARFSYNEIRYTLQPQFNDNYWRNTYELEANVHLPWGISINNDFSYTANTGRTQGFNRNIALWNAEITKSVFKFKRGTFKLSVYDLLNQNIGITRNANLNFIEDARYTVLNSFYMLSFTYSLSKAGNNGPQVNIRMN